MNSPTPTPPIVTVCGSSRFAAEIAWYERHLALAGHPSYAYSLPLPGEPELTDADMETLAARHNRMIDTAEEIHVVSDGSGYCGTNTRGEIARAVRASKPVWYVRVVRALGRWEIEHVQAGESR